MSKSIRLVAGSAYGLTSPMRTNWDTLFAEIVLEPGALLPIDSEIEERALYIVSGEIEIAGDRFAEHQLIVFKPGDRLAVRAVTRARLALVGGAAMDGPRYIWWNFVSSRKERIEDAKEDWKQGRFAKVPGETEFIPLPEG